MYASETELGNGALRHLSVAKIDSIDDSTDTKARELKREFAPARRELLSMGPWKFAQKIASMPQVTNDRTVAWTYKHSLPGDMLYLRGIIDASLQRYIFRDAQAFSTEQFVKQEPHERVGNDTVYSHVSALEADYVFDKENVTLWPSYAQSAFCAVLAERTFMSIVKDEARYEQHQRKTRMIVSEKMSIDLNQQDDQENSFAPQTLARLG
ncbi:MAG: hypothetical protein AAF661_05000 [Pseudomonadota bacterium]